MAVELPARGFIFWPVGTGDSTTIKVNENVFIQVDIHHHASAEDDDEPYNPVIDSLMDVLPDDPADASKRYIAVFALTHADKDHCKGFKELMEKVDAGQLTIGELWLTPRVFRDHKENEELSDDAKAFEDEALRRVAIVCEDGDADSGDRVMVIGNDDILDEDKYAGLPDRYKRRPGEVITELDGADHEGTFKAFIHSPFGDDSTKERNKTSLGMQITLSEGDFDGRVMLLGDLDYPPLKRIFIEYNDDPELTAWDVLLAPHHCSKSAMYFEEEGDSEPVLKQDILDAMENCAGETGWVVASSRPVPSSNKKGDNPPHAVAKERYSEIAPSGFLCTGVYPDEDSDDPIVFSVDSTGIELVSGDSTGTSSASAAVTKARGGDAPHGNAVGFGN